METLNFIQNGAGFSAGHKDRIRRDENVIREALKDKRLAKLAMSALSATALILKEADKVGAAAPEPLSNDERALFAQFGVDTSRTVPVEEMLVNDPAIGGMRHYVRMLSDAVPLSEAARRIGVDPSRLRQRIKEGTILGIHRPGGRQWFIPSFQLTDEGEIPHLSRVLSAAHRHLSALSVYRAFTLPNEELEGVSAREWLISGGDPAPVERLVAGL